jgi:4-amino-4-deoxy-L-arabinose transferase-like glycosyltransferase
MLFGLVLVMNFSRVVRKDYSHDEDQFIASAWLTAEEGLLPYRDYTYFHAPYLVFVYAGLFRLTGDSPFYTARLFSAFCSSVGTFIVFSLVNDLFRRQAGRIGAVVAGGVSLLYLLNPLTAATVGLSWNHDAMTLLLLLGFWFAWHAPGRAHPDRWLFGSGLALALAAGVRLSAITVLPAYLLAIWFYPVKQSFRDYGLRALSLGSGLAVGLLPMLILFLLSPQDFIFGNFEYAILNTRYRIDVPVLYEGHTAVFGPSSLAEKMKFLVDQVLSQPANLLVLLLLAIFGWTILVAAAWKGQIPRYLAVLVLLLVPFAGIGSFLPSPAWTQYFFVILPFALLGIAYGMAVLAQRDTGQAKWLLALFTWVVLLTLLYQFPDIRRLSFLRYPELWRPTLIHQTGLQIRDLVGEEQSVFTLSPLYLVEAGLPVDRHFVTGAFAYRTGALLTAQERRRYGIISEDDLETYLDENPPDGILTGLDLLLDEKIQAYAVKRGYRAKELEAGLSLWLKTR